MADSHRLPARQDIRVEQLGKLIPKFLLIRAIFLPVGAIFLAVIVLADATTWKVSALGCAVALLAFISVLDWVRLRRGRPYPAKNYPMELGLGLLMQAAIIWLTGAIESPVLVAFVPLSMLIGIALGQARQRNMLLLGQSALVWLMALCGLLGWTPRTLPSFLFLEHGFHDQTVYVLTKTVIFNIALIIASRVGVGISNTIDGMVDGALGARQQTLDLLTERNSELVFMSGALAHELKNPLASIQGLVQLLARAGGDPRRQAGRLEMLGKEVDRMRQTLDELLNFSRPLGDLTLRQVDPVEMQAELSSLHEGLARASGVRLLPAEGETPPLVRCDPRKVKQALINLLQNALHATPEGGTVRWVAARQQQRVVLGVEDNGPGLDPEVAERATEAGVTTREGGSGIGLTVARGIAEQHGGELLLGPSPHGGCRAVLELPSESATEAAGAEPQEA